MRRSVMILAALLGIFSGCTSSHPLKSCAPEAGEGRGTICSQVEQVGQAFEPERAFLGDATVLRYGPAFPEHRDVATRALALTNATLAEPFYPIEGTVVGDAAAGPATITGLTRASAELLAPYIKAGSFEPLFSDEEQGAVMLGTELAKRLGVGVGDDIDVLVRDEEAALKGARSMRVAALLEMPMNRLGSPEMEMMVANLRVVQGMISRRGEDPADLVAGVAIRFPDGGDRAELFSSLRRELADSGVRVMDLRRPSEGFEKMRRAVRDRCAKMDAGK
jgi:ABC-type lipoprotein release transport system permease subunit